jgi:hypothetical protein
MSISTINSPKHQKHADGLAEALRLKATTYRPDPSPKINRTTPVVGMAEVMAVLVNYPDPEVRDNLKREMSFEPATKATMVTDSLAHWLSSALVFSETVFGLGYWSEVLDYLESVDNRTFFTPDMPEGIDSEGGTCD